MAVPTAPPKDKPTPIVKGAVPETPEELTELLADEKQAAAIFADSEIRAEFLQKYVKAVNKARPDLARLVQEETEKGIRNFMIENGINRPDVTANVRDLPQKGAAYSKRAIGAALDKEFVDTADFMESIWYKSPGGADRWKKIRNDYSSLEPSAGGFLVPEVLRAELLRVALETAIVRPRGRVIPMDSATVPFPTIDSTSNASTVYGGVSASWVEEGGTLPESEAKFGRVLLRASKLVSRCDVPNELLSDSIISFAAFIDSILPAALAWFEDVAFINGTGVGQPLGVMNSPALVSVAKETGQGADTLLWENIVNMYPRMLPASLGSAVWVANIDTFPQLATMSLAVGTGGSAIWLNNGVVGPPMSILGRPVIFTEKMETLGGGGSGKDIAFLDFGYYLIGDRMQMRAESSIHAQFTADQTVFRIIERVDGRGWLQSAITPRKGTKTLSPFVTLDERA
jgi:HK97 family phage major capsid protein